MNVSQNGERILDALLWRIRVIAFPQVVELVGNVEAEKCLRSLLRNDLVEPLHVRVKLLRLVEPIFECCLLYTSPSPRDRTRSRMPSSA